MDVIRVGTRGSALALAQTRAFVADLTAVGLTCEAVVIKTDGDVNPTPLVELAGQLGGTGIFTSALRDALLAGTIDLAVHSLKDLPTAAVDGLVLAVVPERADPADVLVSTHGGAVEDLPAGARVGTGSPRRAVQLLALRPDLVVEPIRGNVDTRLSMVGRDYDAVVLAAAGLARLGLTGVGAVPIPTDVMVPAPGQGALAVEARSADLGTDWLVAVTALDHRDSRDRVCAERVLLATLDAGCTAPVGALARIDPVSGELHLAAAVGPPQRSEPGTPTSGAPTVLRRSIHGSRDTAAELGAALGRELLVHPLLEPV
ncbi:MAG TPA: hydroxymethylbilane synthase [Actinopolymorphaceae bacterium]|jgi:hydroxymethylbilane synthase